MTEEIKKILEEVYKIDPSFREKESELVGLVKKMIARKPKIEVDQYFVKRLKSEIEQVSEKKNNLGLWGNKKLWLAPVGLVVIVAAVFLTKDLVGPKDTLFLAGSPEVASLEDGAFGELGMSDGAQNEEMLAGKGGGGGMPEMARASIMPHYQEYEFKLADGNLEVELADQVTVYKREKGDWLAKDFAQALGGIDFGLLEINNKNSLVAQNVTLAEDKDFGLLYNFNLSDNSISISQNWSKWDQGQGEVRCLSLDCDPRKPLTEKDLMSDQDLVRMTDKFLNELRIAKNIYGEPVVQKDFEDVFVPEGEKRYIPENITVIYPFEVSGKKVYDMNGNEMGLNVSVNLRYKRVSGVHNLREVNYLTSNYEAVSDFGEIKKEIEKKENPYFFDEKDESEKEVLKLGRPTLGFMFYTQYVNNSHSEYLVPALKFDVQDRPENFWRKSIMVPLVKEMFENGIGRY